MTPSIAACSIHALQPVIIKKEPFWNSPSGEVLARTRRSRSIKFIRKLPHQRRIYLDVETSTSIAPSGRHPTASYTLSNGGCEPSTPRVDPTTLSLCPRVIKYSLLHANTKQRDKTTSSTQALRNGHCKLQENSRNTRQFTRTQHVRLETCGGTKRLIHIHASASCELTSTYLDPTALPLSVKNGETPQTRHVTTFRNIQTQMWPASSTSVSQVRP